MVNAIASLTTPAFVPPSGMNMLPAQLCRPAVPMPASRTSRLPAARSRLPDSDTGPIGMPRWRYERHVSTDAQTRMQRSVIDPVPGDDILPPLSAELPNQMPRVSRGLPGAEAAAPPRRPPPEILAQMLEQLNHCRSGVLSLDEADACRAQGLSSVVPAKAETPPARPSPPNHVPHEQFTHGPGRLRHIHLPKLLQRMQHQLTALQSILENGCASILPEKETEPQRPDAHPDASDRADASGFVSPTPSRAANIPDDEELREWLRNAPHQHQITGFGIIDGDNQKPLERPATPHRQD